MEVFARVGGGTTKHLAERDEAGSLPVILDGPYGGPNSTLEVYDRVLLVGGGSGKVFALDVGDEF